MIARNHDHYIACPGCRQELRVRYPGRSGITRTEWSDTFYGDQKYAFCALSACPSCDKAFWVKDQPKLEREARPTARDTAYVQALILGVGRCGGTDQPFDESLLPEHGELFVLPASNQKKIEALASSLPADRVLYLRTQLWHNANHPQRSFPVDAAEAIPENFRLANLRWLLKHYESLPNDDRDEVIEAELLREMGLFDEAIERMKCALLSGSTRAVAIHQQLLDKRAAVCIVREGGQEVIY